MWSYASVRLSGEGDTLVGMEADQQVSIAKTDRMMKIQEVILKAMAGKLKWWEAAEIIGITNRTMRRWRERYEGHSYSELWDYRKEAAEPASGCLSRSLRKCCVCIGSSITTSTCGTFTRD